MATVVRKNKKRLIKTYRVIRDEMKVGHSVRRYGELIPEAGSWPNIRPWLNEQWIEEVTVTPEELEEAKAEFIEREQEASKPKRRVVRIKKRPSTTTARKRVVKIKRSKTNADKQEGRRLQEQSV